MEAYLSRYHGLTARNYRWQFSAFVRAAKAAGFATETRADWLTLNKDDIGLIYAYAGGYGQARQSTALLRNFLRDLSGEVWKEDRPVSAPEVLRLPETDDNQTLLEMAKQGSLLSDHQKACVAVSRYRDLSIIWISIEAGLPLGALQALNIQDIHWKDRQIQSDGHLYPLSKGTMDALSHYVMDERDEADNDPAALFVSRQGNRMSRRALERITAKYLCDKNGAPLSIRDLRKRRIAQITETYTNLNDALDACGFTSPARFAAYQKEARRQREKEEQKQQDDEFAAAK